MLSRLRLWCVLSLILVGCTATASPTPTPPVLNGTYGCTGYENGLLAGLGSVTFAADGQFVDAAFYGPNPPSQTAQWTYDATTQEIHFTPEIEIERGVYDPATDRLTFYLRPEASRAHAEGGSFGCQKLP